ncbi:MAG: hypothetical protein QOG50_895 [Actinomycetota bacterium]|nr:hypothetical protein [Actinomycetota bacterium]
MIGAVILIFAMLVVGPVGLFLVGAIWSGVTGWLLSDDADQAPEDREYEAQPSS